MAFGNRLMRLSLLFGAMLPLAAVSADADDFADVDPERLARGVEILAVMWTIPTVVFPGATDDFANSDKSVPLPSPKPASATIEDDPQPGWPYYPSVDIIPEGFLYGMAPEEILGAITRRRD